MHPYDRPNNRMLFVPSSERKRQKRVRRTKKGRRRFYIGLTVVGLAVAASSLLVLHEALYKKLRLPGQPVMVNAGLSLPERISNPNGPAGAFNAKDGKPGKKPLNFVTGDSLPAPVR